MSCVNLVDEYLHAAHSLDFTFDELAKMALNSFEAAFLPEAERAKLILRAQGEIEAMRHG